MRSTAVMTNWPDMLKLIPKLLMIMGKISLGMRYIVASRHELEMSVACCRSSTCLPVENNEEKYEEDSKS